MTYVRIRVVQAHKRPLYTINNAAFFLQTHYFCKAAKIFLDFTRPFCYNTTMKIE